MGGHRAEEEAGQEEGGDEDRGPGGTVQSDPGIMVVMMVVVFQSDQGISFSKL